MAKMGGPAAFGDAAEAGTRYCDEANTDTTFQQRTLAARRLRRRQQLENINNLASTRVWAELIEELERYGGRDLDARLARYARLDPALHWRVPSGGGRIVRGGGRAPAVSGMRRNPETEIDPPPPDLRDRYSHRPQSQRRDR